MDRKWVYLFDEVDQAEAYVGVLGRGARPARRQGRQPGRDDPPRAAGAARLHRHHRGLQRLPGRRRRLPGRHVGAGARRRSSRSRRDRQELRRRPEPAARLLPLGREVLDAGHDGHRAQHRPERRRRPGHGRAHRRRALRLTTPIAAWSRCSARSCWSSPTSRSRRCSSGPARKAGVKNDAELTAEDCRRSSRSSRRSSGAVRPRFPRRSLRAAAPGHRGRVPSRGTASAPSTTATPPTSPTTWAPPSTS